MLAMSGVGLMPLVDEVCGYKPFTNEYHKMFKEVMKHKTPKIVKPI